MNTFYVILFILLPVVGIGLLLYALFLGRNLEGNPIKIKIDRPRLDLELDRLSLVILLGVFLMIFGVIIWNQGYKIKASRMEYDLKSAKNEITTKNNLLEKFKCYSVKFPLIFPENGNINPNDISVQVYILKPGMESAKLCDFKKITSLSNDISVSIEYLNPGDRLRIRAQEVENREWEGINIVEIPKIDIQMRRVR